jgi:hypothetical protein
MATYDAAHPHAEPDSSTAGGRSEPDESSG